MSGIDSERFRELVDLCGVDNHDEKLTPYTDLIDHCNAVIDALLTSEKSKRFMMEQQYSREMEKAQRYAELHRLMREPDLHFESLREFQREATKLEAHFMEED